MSVRFCGLYEWTKSRANRKKRSTFCSWQERRKIFNTDFLNFKCKKKKKNTEEKWLRRYKNLFVIQWALSCNDCVFLSRTSGSPAVKFACCLCYRKCGTLIYCSTTCLKRREWLSQLPGTGSCKEQKHVQHKLHVFIAVLRHNICVINCRVFLHKMAVILGMSPLRQYILSVLT